MTKSTVFLFLSLVAGLNLSGCEAADLNLDAFNHGSGINTTIPTKFSSRSWQVSDQEAMAWLSHDNIAWNDHGKITEINWYEFWCKQIHYKTALASRGYQYCHTYSWADKKTGDNCETYFQAYSVTQSEGVFD